MRALEQAVINAALNWGDAVTLALQTSGASDELGPEEEALYEAVCAYRAERGNI